MTSSIYVHLMFWRKGLTEPGDHWLARQAEQQSLEIPISAQTIGVCYHSWL